MSSVLAKKCFQNLHVIKIDNLIKGIVPAVPITNRSATTDPCIALTIDWISSGEDHRISRDEVASATDVVTKLQDTSEVISMLESLEKRRILVKYEKDSNIKDSLDNMGKFPILNCLQSS